MKKFLIRVFVFLLLPVLFFVTNMVINRLIYINQSPQINNYNIIIAGDSHPQRSINPSYFSSAKNISQTIEPYILTYWKLKKIFETNNPDTLILGFGPHNISGFNDFKFSDNLWSNEIFKRCYPIEELYTIDQKIPVDYRAFYKTLWKQTAFYPKKDHIHYIGKYKNGDLNRYDNWEKVINRHYYLNNNVLSVSEISIAYLDSIINLCHKKEVELVLISNPVYFKYYDNIPDSINSKYSSLKKELSSNHLIFDKTNANYSDALFYDSDHLNNKGAEIFTKELQQFLNQKNKLNILP